MGRFSEEEVLSMPRGNILRMICSSRDLSMVIQALLIGSSDELVERVLEEIKVDFFNLLFHKYAVYIIMRLLNRSVEAVKLLQRASLIHFEEMCYDEYASRAIQVLARIDKNFRINTIKWFVKHWPRSVGSISGVFLLSACIKHSKE